MKTDRLLRLLSIIEQIRRQPGISYYTLAEEFSITERTVRRDINLLEQAGFPLQNHKGLRFLSDVDIPKFELNPDEAATLLLIINALSNFRLNFENIKKVSSKLKKSVSEKMFDECENISEKIFIDSGNKNDYEEEVLQTLIQVLQSQHKIKILYNSFSSNNKKWRTIDPYGIFFKRRAWYIAAYCHLRSDVRVFRCNRIEKIEHLKDSYSVPDDFKVKNFLENSWELMQGDPARITVKFSQEVTPLIKETVFHNKETKKEVADGIIYEVEVANWKEIYFWIMSFGKNAEIISPKWLRKKCEEELREIVRKYEEDGY